MAYSDKKISPSNINYTSKDFSSIKTDLIEYTKAYFPDTYKDFNETSPGMMLIELASYVGDVLSYYIDYNYKESLLTTATERKNVLRLAEFLGYKTTPVTPSVVKLRVTTDVGVNDEFKPNYAELVDKGLGSTLASGLQISSIENPDLKFETIGELDFNISGSQDNEPAYIVSRDAQSRPQSYRLTRYVQAVSGETKTKEFTITSPTKFLELDLGITDVVEILDVTDSSNAKWYEVDYLAQDRILKETHYSNDSDRTSAYDQGLSNTQEYSVDVSIPYTLEYINTNKKFVKKVDPVTNNTKLQFGNGLFKQNISGSSSAGLFATIEQQGMNVSGVPSSVINSAINNLTTNNSLNLGETPANTILTVKYRQGGGADTNVQAGELTQVENSSATITVTNPEPSSGGTDGETITEIKENAKTFFASQLRCVTREDYAARILNLPAKFGNIAKAQVVRLNDVSGLNIYTLSYNQRRQLVNTPDLVLDNLRMYLEQFRMINDALTFGFELGTGATFSGYKINFGVYFAINVDRRFNPTDVKIEVMECVKEFFEIDKMRFGQAINLNELRYEILGKEGVIALPKLQIFQTTTEIEGYETGVGRNLAEYDAFGQLAGDPEQRQAGYGFVYSFQNALQNDIIRPARTPAVFELRNPNTDIIGRVL